MGDLDGDGIADLAIGSPDFTFAALGSYAMGRVDVLSGATNLPLYHLDVDTENFERAAQTLVNMGDIDGDAINDLLISSSSERIAYVVSGVDGHLLYSIYPDNFSHPDDFDIIADLNGDQIPEIVAGFWSESFDPTGPALLFQTGFMRIFDGADGSLMLELHGQRNFQGFAAKVLGASDLNGDGIGDLVTIDKGFGLGNFALRAHSGVNGEELFTVRDQRVNTLSEISIDNLDDFNGDGTPDLLLSGHTFENAAGHATGFTAILSGADGSRLHEILGAGYPWPGRKAANLGDVNGDGVADFGISLPIDVNGESHLGVEVYSGADASLITLIDSGQESWYSHSLAPVSDRDGDGISDLMLGIGDSNTYTESWDSDGEVQIWAVH